MFGSNNKSSSKSSTSTSGSLNSLVGGTNVKGDISCENDIGIDGTLTGNLSCKGKVIIGNAGRVEGIVSCVNCVIEGTFDGELNVSENLSVKESAKVNGDVVTDKLIIQSGAVFNVHCSMKNTSFG